MAKRFLSRDLIVSAAYKMIDENGTEAFSVRQLASKLGVQVSSLYNHINNEYDLLVEVAKLAAKKYSETIQSAIKCLSPEEGLYKGGECFRAFVNEHRYLYELLIDRRWIGDPEFTKVNDIFTLPIARYLDQFHVKDKAVRERIYIAMRVVTHGFSSLEVNGVFDGLTVDTTTSYHTMLKPVVDLIKQYSEKES